MSDQHQRLIEAALDAAKSAYAPYSNYPVGAALLAEDGEIYRGCNIENASFGLTNCGERTALFTAIANGNRTFEAIAIVTRDGGAPCGACRQVLNEFAPQAEVLIADATGTLVRRYRSVSELLPDAFGPKNVNDSKPDEI